MSRFKICPYCKTKNEPSELECIECGSDISTVKIMDETTLSAESAAKAEPVTAQKEEQKKPVRVCSECGHANPANARKCENCGEDISDIMPAVLEEQEEPKFALFSITGDYAYEILKEEVIIGREQEMQEYLSGKAFVSRKHCRILKKPEGILVKDLGSSNGTFVNNKVITEEVALHDGDELGIGGCVVNGKRQAQAAYFKVKEKRCTSQGSCTR